MYTQVNLIDATVKLNKQQANNACYEQSSQNHSTDAFFRHSNGGPGSYHMLDGSCWHEATVDPEASYYLHLTHLDLAPSASLVLILNDPLDETLPKPETICNWFNDNSNTKDQMLLEADVNRSECIQIVQQYNTDNSDLPPFDIASFDMGTNDCYGQYYAFDYFSEDLADGHELYQVCLLDELYDWSECEWIGDSSQTEDQQLLVGSGSSPLGCVDTVHKYNHEHPDLRAFDIASFGLSGDCWGQFLSEDPLTFDESNYYICIVPDVWSLRAGDNLVGDATMTVAMPATRRVTIGFMSNENHNETGQREYYHEGYDFCVSTNPLTCEPFECNATEVPHSDKAASGAIMGVVGDVVEVVCASGYMGGGNTSCDATGTFDVNTVTCLRQCTPTLVAHSDYAQTNLSGLEGESVLVTCDYGYSGGGNATCDETGAYNVSNCTAIPCGSMDIVNSDYSAWRSIQGSHGDMVHITCDVGYTRNCESMELYCNGMTEWWYSFGCVSCDIVLCEDTNISHSNYANVSSLTGTYGTNVSVTCDEGYTATSAWTACTAEGTFSPVECVLNECESTELAYSDYAVSNSITGVTDDVITVTCIDGYSGGGQHNT